MKKFLIYPLALFVALTSMAVSCDDTSDLLEITKDLNFPETVNLNSNGENTAEVFNFSTIDPSTESGFSTLQDKIKDIEITKITYTILEKAVGHSSDAILTIELAYRASEASDLTLLKDLLSPLSEIDVENEINASAEDLEAIRTLLLAGDKIDVAAYGNLESGPVNIDVKFNVYTKITAAP